MQVSQLVSIDSRNPFHKLRRRQCWALAKVNNIPFPAGADKETMIKLLEANGVNPFQADVIEWEDVEVRNERGEVTGTVKYPKVKEHASAKSSDAVSAELARRLEANVQKAKEADEKQQAQETEIESLKRQLDEQSKLINQLVEAKLPRKPGRPKKVEKAIKEHGENTA